MTTEHRQHRLSRGVYATAAIALAVVLFISLNIVSTVWLRAMRIDLTENGLYTLSDGTRATLAKLKEPITLRFFFSREVAAGYSQVRAYADEVRDLLQEYAAYAPGMIRLEEIDPAPYTPEEDAAGAAGLTGAPTQEGDQVYFGLAGSNTINGHETIPFFSQDREEYLEYDITAAIYRLANPARPRLGVLSTIPLEAGPGGLMAALQGQSSPFVIYEQLAQTFDLKAIDPSADRIPPEVKTLLLVHPAGLGPRTLYAIDQFVLRGGKIIVIVDPLSEIMGAQQEGMGGGGQAPVSSDLAPLFKAWGLAYDASKVVGDASRAQRVRVGDPRNPAVDYVVWLKLSADDFNHDDPVTANLQALNIASAGALRPVTGATTHFTPLVMTSGDAALLDAIEVRVTQSPVDLLRRFQPTGERYAIAARLTGPAKSAFPRAPPPAAVPEPPAGRPPPPPPAPLPPYIASAKDINVVVMADSDFLDDRFWVQVQNAGGRRVATQFADNGSFLLNAAENMMGASDLIRLRTRSRATRPFTVVQELQREAEVRFLAEAQSLQQKVQQTEAALRQLQGQAPPQAGQPAPQANAQGETLTKEQQAEIEKFRTELVDTRARLREVQANLRRDVVNLGSVLAFINIALVPILVAAAAIGLATIRRRRRAHARKLV